VSKGRVMAHWDHIVKQDAAYFRCVGWTLSGVFRPVRESLLKTIGDLRHPFRWRCRRSRCPGLAPGAMSPNPTLPPMSMRIVGKLSSPSRHTRLDIVSDQPSQRGLGLHHSVPDLLAVDAYSPAGGLKPGAPAMFCTTYPLRQKVQTSLVASGDATGDRGTARRRRRRCKNGRRAVH
jgi:hypothetical protein